MKKAQTITIALFFVLLSIPILAFNWQENVVSEIDNRSLTNNPFGNNYESDSQEYLDLSSALESYVQDRIGFRDQMISLYTTANDKVFNKMVHPSYEYGKNGYIFGKASRNGKYSEYHIAFADMVEKIQNYCEERSVPFVFVLNPSKTSVLSENLRAGINYNNDWLKEFLKELDLRGINYVDNSVTLKQKTVQGENVFNQKYDANHWNELGAFYGVNASLENLQKYFPHITLNEKSDFTITEELQTSLLVSKFPINEYTPSFDINRSIINRTSDYSDELLLNPQYRSFGYYINPQKDDMDLPKTLVFQGSYMNTKGYKFMQNALEEYIHVHDYQNIMNFGYYYNIFKPKCVIFEVAEYTFSNTYFNYDAMVNMDLQPVLSQQDIVTAELSPAEEITTDNVFLNLQNQLVNIIISGLDDDAKYAYAIINGEIFDMKKKNSDFKLSIEKEKYNFDNLKIIVKTSGGEIIKYQTTSN